MVDEVKARIETLKAELAELQGVDAEAKTLEWAKNTSAKAKELKAARAELAAIEEAEAELAEATKPDAPKLVEDPKEPAEVEAPEVDDEVDTEAPAEVEVPEEAPVSDEVVEGGAEVEDAAALTLAASAHDVSPTASAPAVKPVTLTASMSTGSVTVGSDMSREDVLEVLQASMRAGSTEGRGTLLRLNNFAPGTKVLTPEMGPVEATEIIREAVESNQKTQALTAAACFCGPDEVKEDFQAIGSRLRPVAGVFPSVAANGGFRFFRDLAINPDSGATRVWTCDDQDLVDPGDEETWKPCPELDCFDEETVYPYMLVGCTTVNRTQMWAHRYQVDRWLDKLRIEYARTAERALLDIIETDGGTPLEVGAANMAAYGLIAQLDYALGSLAHSLGYQFREADLAGYVAIIPRGMIAAMLADERIRGFRSTLNSEAAIRAHFEQGYGIRLVERLDESSALAATSQATVTALNAGGNIDANGTPLVTPQQRIYLVRPDQWLHAQGSMVSADWHVDNQLLRQNKLQYFWEDVEQLTRTGLEKTHIIDLNGCIKGAFSDLVTPPAC